MRAMLMGTMGTGVLIFSAVAGFAQQVGDTLIVGTDQAKVFVDNNVVGTAEIGDLLRIRKVSSDWCLVTVPKKRKEKTDIEGWVNRIDLVSRGNALEHFSYKIRSKPTARLHDIRGNIWYWNGKFEPAINDFTEAIRLDPFLVAARVHRGIVRSGKGESEEALADFNDAVKLDPADHLPWFHRGREWSRQREYDKAIADLSEAIGIDPEYATAHWERGFAWLAMGEHDKALVDLDEEIRINPNYAPAYSLRGGVRNEIEEYERAIADFTESIRLEPKHIAARNSLAWLLATCPNDKFRDGKQAVELATKLCESARWKDASLIDTLGAAHAETGDFMAAIEMQRLAIELASPKEKTEMKARLKSYQAGRPLRLKAKKSSRG
ncbi:MAG: tetratricopeptide repeat protein [Planctomycetia bacterium]|nr:tetratricopeptide repeat protein [Planctomycetia bacterium]